jgi:NitT/TauT family transport system substrate-binding protein
MFSVKRVAAAFLFFFFIAAPVLADDLPVIRVGYIFTTNHTPLMAAMSLGPELVVDGYSLQTLLPKEKYELRKDGKPVARLDVLVAKSGSETSTLFAQKHLDIALCSLTAILSGIDKGVGIKVVSPIILASGGLVVLKESPVQTWNDFVALAKGSKEPVKVGYHSPNSAPIIILEEALRSEGLSITSNPNDASAKILLVDLKGTSNMLPALASKQVDAAVGPEPFPQTAVFRGSGRMIEELRNMPPKDKWQQYPCCVLSASDDFIAAHPELVGEFVRFFGAANRWCNDNPEKAGSVGAAWLGLPEQVGGMQRLRFLDRFTDSWKQGVDGYLEVLNASGYFTGSLKGKRFADAEKLLVNDSFLK